MLLRSGLSTVPQGNFSILSISFRLSNRRSGIFRSPIAADDRGPRGGIPILDPEVVHTQCEVRMWEWFSA